VTIPKLAGVLLIGRELLRPRCPKTATREITMTTSDLRGLLKALSMPAFFACLASASTVAAELQTNEAIRGLVLDAHTGQAIEKARVSAREARTSTDREGRFTISTSSREAVEVSVAAVGYGVVRKTVSPAPNDVVFHLAQDAVAHAERVDVRPEVFEHNRDAPLAYSLQNLELRNLSSVMADDVLRSVQALPGVSAGDDFYGTFSVRGWGFQNSGLYVDGVLVNSPFHTIRDLNDAFSLTILNNDIIDGVTLLSGASPARYGDRVGGVLNIETRDGSRERTTARANLGATGVSFFAEGPIGGSGTSWLLGARKSFLDYVLNAIEDNPSFVIGYYDVQAKLSRRAGAHTLSLFMLHGDSDYEDGEEDLARNDVARASSATQLLSARWVWTPSTRSSLTMAGFWSRETGLNRNAVSEGLFDSTSGQLGGKVDFTRGLGDSHLLQAGLLARNLASRGTETAYPRTGPASSRIAFDKAQWQPGAYLQDGWRSPSGRVAITAGVRVDRSSALQDHKVLPRANGSLRLSDRSSLSFAAGAYSQFPNLEQLFGSAGNEKLLAEESDHYTVGFEHQLSSTTRAQVQIYHQEERQRLGQSSLEIRFQGGQLILPRDGRLSNSWSGTSRGVEATLQRRSPNGLTGWVSYALARADLRDSETGLTFDSDFDQRHTLNAYLSYRLSDRTNVSAKFRYGSNTPVTGYFEETASGVRVSDERNVLRLPVYSRLDLRASQTFSIGRARLTAHAEIMNALNHANYRYAGRSILPSAQVFFDRETLFPFLPAASLTVEW
jgi:outer membrane cobalamin receptor